MLLKNTQPRLISINANGMSFDLMPAVEFTDIPDAVCDHAYVKALISSGDVKIVGESKEVVSDYDSMTKEELLAEAKENA